MESSLQVHPGEVATVCVQRSGFTQSFNSFIYVDLNNDGTPHSGDFRYATLSFPLNQNQVCFDLPIAAVNVAASYDLNIRGTEEVLVVEVTPNNELFCGVFKNNNPANASPSTEGNSDFDFSDRFGNYYTAEELAFNTAGIMCASSGHFLLDFSPDFTPEQANTICRAFEDISLLFNSAHSDIPIRIRKEDLGTGINGAATAFWRADGLFNGCGIESNLVWEHINTDADFDQILAPGYSAGEFRINLTGVQWHTLNLDAGGDFNNPGVGAIATDLYSLALHEIMHILGFSSRITADGSPLNGFYSLWDRQLMGNFPSTTPPISIIVPITNNPECCDAHQYNPAIGIDPGLLNINCNLSNPEAVFYQYGPNPSDRATVFGDYAPGSFNDLTAQTINILSHINRVCNNEPYVMHSSLVQR
ncbi:MAG: hypothetical protein DA408_03585 [Bacteroidetes bacterium]|nr:MAG: hypothetical protein DA408_03585 [Bacteroidota bacterium]